MRYLALSLAVALSCGRSGEKGGEAPAVPPQPDPKLDRPFVVFRQTRLLIDRLESPVPALVTVGSQPSPSTMESDTPEVVSVEPNGALIAHRLGVVLIRPLGRGGAPLAVEVRPASVIAIEPARIFLPLEGKAPIRAVGGDRGETLPARSVQWLTSDPSVAWVDGGTLRAGKRLGKVRIVARYGGQEAVAEVSVGKGLRTQSPTDLVSSSRSSRPGGTR